MKLQWDFQELIDFKNNLINLSNRTNTFKRITRDITRVLHQYLLVNTPVDTENLKRMWNTDDNLSFTVIPTENGYSITLYNSASNNKSKKYPNFQYGLAVNDGHKKPGGNGWVVGQFFVEKSIAQTAHSSQIEQIIMQELQKWWDSI